MISQSIYEISTGKILYTVTVPDSEAGLYGGPGLGVIIGSYDPDSYSIDGSGNPVSGDQGNDADLPDPDSIFQRISEKDTAGGYAGLDVGGKVPTAEIPDLSYTYQATSGKGVANGYAGLDSDGKVFATQLPSYVASISVNGPLSSTGGETPTLSISQATGTTDGYLSSTDWTAFNSKLSANQTITLTGDATGSGSTSIPVTLASIVTAGTAAKITYNAKGQVTGGASLAVSDMPSQVVAWPVIVPFVGKPGNAQLFTLVYFTQSVQFPASLTGSGGTVLTANPAATYTATIYKNGSSVGTISISTSGVFTFAFASAVTFAAGDVMKVVGQATADTTLQDLSFTVVGAAV